MKEYYNDVERGKQEQTQEGIMAHLRTKRRAVLLKDRKLRMMHSKKQDQRLSLHSSDPRVLCVSVLTTRGHPRPSTCLVLHLRTVVSVP